MIANFKRGLPRLRCNLAMTTFTSSLFTTTYYFKQVRVSRPKLFVIQYSLFIKKCGLPRLLRNLAMTMPTIFLCADRQNGLYYHSRNNPSVFGYAKSSSLYTRECFYCAFQLGLYNIQKQNALFMLANAVRPYNITDY